MTVPQQPHFIDSANPLLTQAPAQMETGTLSIPGHGTVAVLTFRSATTTMTVMLVPDDLKNWVRVLTALEGSMSASGLQVVSGSVINGVAR